MNEQKKPLGNGHIQKQDLSRYSGKQALVLSTAEL